MGLTVMLSGVVHLHHRRIAADAFRRLDADAYPALHLAAALGFRVRQHLLVHLEQDLISVGPRLARPVGQPLVQGRAGYLLQGIAQLMVQLFVTRLLLLLGHLQGLVEALRVRHRPLGEADHVVDVEAPLTFRHG